MADGYYSLRCQETGGGGLVSKRDADAPRSVVARCVDLRQPLQRTVAKHLVVGIAEGTDAEGTRFHLLAHFLEPEVAAGSLGPGTSSTNAIDCSTITKLVSNAQDEDTGETRPQCVTVLTLTLMTKLVSG